MSSWNHWFITARLPISSHLALLLAFHRLQHHTQVLASLTFPYDTRHIGVFRKKFGLLVAAMSAVTTHVPQHQQAAAAAAAHGHSQPQNSGKDVYFLIKSNIFSLI